MRVVHACPPKGSGVMPCCGRTPFERLGDRMTLEPSLVTCGTDPFTFAQVLALRRMACEMAEMFDVSEADAWRALRAAVNSDAAPLVSTGPTP